MGEFHENTQGSAKPRSSAKKWGIVLLIISCVLYGIAFIIPFVGAGGGNKYIVAGVFAVLGEITFWISCIIVGKELMKRYRKYLNPVNWFKGSGKNDT